MRLEHAELRSAGDRGGVVDLEAEAHVGLVGAVPRHRLRVGHPRKRPGRRLAPHGLERRDDAALEHVEHVLSVDEGHLEVELPELELPVGAEILVAPARRNLVVAVEAADHRQLLEELRRLRERVEPSRLQPDGHEEVAGALGRALRHARCPHVDEAELVHLAADRADDRVVEAQVALHALAAHVQIPVPEPQDLVDALVADLERQRVRRGEDAEHVDLHFDLTCREIRIDGVGARSTTSPSAWSTNSLRTSCATSAAAGARSGLITSCVSPVWSRRSTNTSRP